MTKILIFPDFDEFGGTRTYLKHLVEFYHLYNCEVTVAVENASEDEDITKFFLQNNIEWLILQKDPRDLFQSQTINLLLDLFISIPVIIRKKPDIVIVSTGKAGKFLGLFLIFPIRLIYVLHTYPSCEKPVTLYKIVLFLMMNAKKRILTVSEFSKRQISLCWLGNRDLRWIDSVYNYSSLESIKPQSGATNNNSPLKILTIGHVRWYKNPETWYSVAIKTSEKYPGKIEFIWAGDGELLEYYREKCISEGNNSIRFIGFQKNVSLLYADCAIYFQPSLLESQGMAVIDAMRMGLPCVVSNVGGLTESVIDGISGFVIDKDNQELMVEKLLVLLENEELRNKMGTEGSKYYKDHFTKDIWKRKMTELHKKLLPSFGNR